MLDKYLYLIFYLLKIKSLLLLLLLYYYYYYSVFTRLDLVPYPY